MPSTSPSKNPIYWLCALGLIALFGLLYAINQSANEEDQPGAWQPPPSDQLFFDAEQSLDSLAELWLARLRSDYKVDDAAAWQPADVACSGRVLLAGQDDHDGTQLFGFVQFDTRDSSSVVYEPVTATTDTNGSFTIRFTRKLPTQATWSMNANFILASSAVMEPRLRLFMRHPGYDGLALTLRFEQHETDQHFGTVELLPAGAHAARINASFGNKGHHRHGLFDNKQCDPANILREYAADPTLATCDDAMFHFLTTIRQSGWGRQWNTEADFHEGFVAFRQHFMDGKDNTGQLMSMGIINDDASWAGTFNRIEAEFYHVYLPKLFQTNPAAVIDLVSKNKQLLPHALPPAPSASRQQLLANSPEYGQILFTMLEDEAMRFRVVTTVGLARDRRAVPILIAMLQEKPAIDGQASRSIERHLAYILELEAQQGRDRDWLDWWEAEGQHIDWPEPPKTIEFEEPTP